MAMTHILRASLDIDESIANNRMPEQIVKLVRYCNQNLITSFPYRCILRVARRLVQFPEIVSKDFMELLICRITMQHPDIPSLLKVLRRVLEARNTALTESEAKDDPEFWLKDLKYYPQTLAFLEGLLENKEQIEASLLSNVNPRAAPGVDSTRSFDVDGEREPSIRVDIKGIPDDREIDIDGTFIQVPPKSINFTAGAIEVGDAVAPRSFRYRGEAALDSPLPSPTSVRYSTLGAQYEPIDSQYHSKKAAQYDEKEDDEDIFATRPRNNIPMSSINATYSQAPSTRRQPPAGGEVPSEATTYLSRQSGTSAMNSERRYSLLDSWKPPSSAAPSSALTSLTISRRGRRAAVVYSRHKSKKKRWFNR
uniref:Uncharacterized protein n=1 Tax=Phytophthora ramorum TaxID=164328 RepID=H3HBH5_PHYRM